MVTNMISDFKAGTKVCQAVLLRVQKIGNSSNGGVFARGLLEDNSGKMPFIVFEAGIVRVPLSLSFDADVQDRPDKHPNL